MNLLNHVAIIMDGNGRWGIHNKKNRNLGHKAGINVVGDIINESIKQKIKFLTLYAFSTENWSRPNKEIDYLFKLLENFLTKNVNEFIKKDIKLKILGEKKFSKRLNFLLNDAEKKTIKNTSLQVNLALNYGSKQEIVRAIKSIINKNQSTTLENVTNNLYTAGIPDPDILIRTGNTKRLSNFLLWQIAYTEIFFFKKMWPDFNTTHFKKIIKEYKNIKRNFGNI
jgi:undecaprenyl diphosphate synthase